MLLSRSRTTFTLSTFMSTFVLTAPGSSDIPFERNFSYTRFRDRSRFHNF